MFLLDAVKASLTLSREREEMYSDLETLRNLRKSGNLQEYYNFLGVNVSATESGMVLLIGDGNSGKSFENTFLYQKYGDLYYRER
jgi:polynucleotide 5'-kinase involved in rRNA processing